ncbi:MAG: imidazoleglycerol-phosphate dehydratase HisB [Methanobacteriota archaeon]|nr:MAG: imidazoleglycerol-phosphate dehydratase HisB [Euryarchaeota archaeon]
MVRTAEIVRKTSETEVQVKLNLDGKGSYRVSTGIGFFDHMLESFARHGSFDLEVTAKGDNEHHIVEDTGIALGEALKKALGDKKGINRFGQAVIPMDEVLILTSVDLSGRAYTSLDVKFRKKKIEDLSAEMIEHFIHSFASEARMNLHIKFLDGRNDHHKAEAIFKSLAIALRMAVAKDATKGLPSTKGVL